MAEHRFHTPGPVELDVQIPVGDIQVETTDGNESVVSVTGTDKLVENTVVELNGDRLIVALKGKKPFGITISIGEFSFGSGGLHVAVRMPHTSSATITTAAADMKLKGRYGQLEVKSASGDLTVTGEIEADATIKSVSGDVRVGSVGGELRVQTVSGDVLAGAISGSIESKTVSGDVRFDSVREGMVTAQSVSGDIEVGVTVGTNLDVDAGSVSGDLSSEVPLGSEPGALLEAGGPTLVVRGKTVSGDFRVFRAA
jgi:Putative adhesin